MNTMTGSTDSGSEWLQGKCEREAGSSPLRVDMYVRSLAPPFGVRRRQEETYDGLLALRDSDVVDTVNLSVWGDGICTEGPCAETSACRRLRDRIERFEEWAAGCERPVEVPFGRRSVSSSIIDDTYEEITTPEICLAIYADDQLAVVLPCTVDGDSICPTDFLEALDQTAVDATLET